MSEEAWAGWRPNTRWPVVGVLDFDDGKLPLRVEIKCALPSPPVDLEITVPGGVLPSCVGRNGRICFGPDESYVVRVIDEHTLRLMVGRWSGPGRAE